MHIAPTKTYNIFYEHQIYRWIKKFSEKGDKALHSKGYLTEMETLEALSKKLREVEMERDILKKALGLGSSKKAMCYEHIDGVKVRSCFSESGKYRYRLEITLDPPPEIGKTVCVVMQNPSRANEEEADKSVQVMEKVVFQKGLPEFTDVRRLIIVTQFAYVQTNDFKGRDDQIGPENDRAIKDALEESDIIIFAWGSANRFEARQEKILAMVQKMQGKILLKTRSHPSRMQYDGFIMPYQNKGQLPVL